MNIGNRIREIRKANGQKLLNIANKTGLSQPFISEIERGVKVPSVETLQSICSALGISMSDFFIEDKPPVAKSLSRLICIAEKLSDDELEQLAKLIEMMKG